MDWQWTHKMVNATCYTQGAFIQALSPLVSMEVAGKPTYLFQSKELQAVAALLFGRISHEERGCLPQYDRQIYFHTVPKVKLHLPVRMKPPAAMSLLPVPCAHQAQESAAIWKYNMKAHFAHHHPLTTFKLYSQEFAISDTERKVPNTSALPISDAHQSCNLDLRTVEDTQEDLILDSETSDSDNDPEAGYATSSVDSLNDSGMDLGPNRASPELFGAVESQENMAVATQASDIGEDTLAEGNF
ncbi:hypothetical protein BD779DRAFT_1683484 [Infundibulicybe gibba]|nr:hypothetical protein BD779DRAFT_1683484 [Infundibulicybe gibba]